MLRMSGPRAAKDKLGSSHVFKFGPFFTVGKKNFLLESHSSLSISMKLCHGPKWLIFPKTLEHTLWEHSLTILYRSSWIMVLLLIFDISMYLFFWLDHFENYFPCPLQSLWCDCVDQLAKSGSIPNIRFPTTMALITVNLAGFGIT